MSNLKPKIHEITRTFTEFSRSKELSLNNFSASLQNYFCILEKQRDKIKG